MRAVLLLVPLALLLPGCFGGEGAPRTQAYGAIYTATVTNADGCTVRVPYPVENGTVWRAMTPDVPAATTAKHVNTSYGPVLELSGAGDLGYNATWTGTKYPPTALSAPQDAFAQVLGGGLETGSFWVQAKSCTGALLNVAWVYDASPSALRVHMRGNLTEAADRDGWQQITATREPLRT